MVYPILMSWIALKSFNRWMPELPRNVKQWVAMIQPKWDVPSSDQNQQAAEVFGLAHGPETG